jgi:O-antigen/teichoic acid export membrane protein
MIAPKKAFISSLIGQPLNIALLLIGTVVTTRLLTPDERGVFSGVMAGFSIVQMLQTFGSGVHLIRRSISDDEIQQAASVVWVGSILAFVLLQFGAPLLAELLREPRSAFVIRILGLSCLLAPLEVLFGGQMLRQMRGAQYMACMLFKSFISVSVAIGCILLGYTFEALALGYIAATFSFAISSWFCIRKDRTWTGFNLPTWDFLKRSASLTGLLLSRGASERLVHPAVLSIQGAYSAGILGTSWGILDIAKQVLVDALMIFVTPLLSGYSDDPKSLRFYFEKMTSIMGGLVPPAFLSAAVLSDDLIGTLFGTRWIAAAPIMAILCYAGALHFSTINFSDFLLAKKRDNAALKFELLMGVFCIAIFSIALTKSLEAAAWSRVFYSACVLGLSISIARLNADIDLRVVAKIFGKNLLVIMATVIPVVLVHEIELNPGVRLVLATSLGLCGYVISLLLTKHILGAEVIKLLSMIQSKAFEAIRR